MRNANLESRMQKKRGTHRERATQYADSKKLNAKQGHNVNLTQNVECKKRGVERYSKIRKSNATQKGFNIRKVEYKSKAVTAKEGNMEIDCK